VDDGGSTAALIFAAGLKRGHELGVFLEIILDGTPEGAAPQPMDDPDPLIAFDPARIEIIGDAGEAFIDVLADDIDF
jgi:hypothetical protein